METTQAYDFVRQLLELMLSRKSSDMFITAGFPPAIKVDGKMTKLSADGLNGTQTGALVRAVMSDRQAAEFETTKECNFAISPVGIGRFRVNAFVQQNQAGMVLQAIPTTVPTIDGLGVPQVLKDVVIAKRGLCILVGATGSGPVRGVATAGPRLRRRSTSSRLRSWLRLCCSRFQWET